MIDARPVLKSDAAVGAAWLECSNPECGYLEHLDTIRVGPDGYPHGHLDLKKWKAHTCPQGKPTPRTPRSS